MIQTQDKTTIPPLSQSKYNPTNSDHLLKKAYGRIKEISARIEKSILVIFDSIAVYAPNQSVEDNDDLDDSDLPPVFLYGLTAETAMRINLDVKTAIDEELQPEEDGESWLEELIAAALFLGTSQTFNNLIRMSFVYSMSRFLALVPSDANYKAQQALLQAQSAAALNALSAKYTSKIVGQIGTAIEAGLSPTAIKAEIKQAVTQFENEAKRLAQAHITEAVRMARLAESEAAERITGKRTMMLWQSALIPTTRPWHASRHGEVYTRDEIKAFYATGGNRFNCHCSFSECFVNKKGEPQIPDNMKQRLKLQKQAWFKSHEKALS